MRAVTLFFPVVLLAAPVALSAQSDECVILHTCQPKHKPAPRPPVPPPARARPPRQMLPVDCATVGDSNYRVFFELDKIYLTPEATGIIDEVVGKYKDQAKEKPGLCIFAAAYTDRRGTTSDNIRRSEREAASVREYLVRHGVPAAMIATNALGEAYPRVETAEGVAEPLNRRVDIWIGHYEPHHGFIITQVDPTQPVFPG